VGKWDNFLGLWLLSWAGDLMGTLIAAPALLAWTLPDSLRWTPRKRIEAALGFAVLMICSVLIFMGKLASFGVGFPFLVLPIVVWIAVRLGQRATVSATLLTCAFSVWGTRHGMGPFARLDLSSPVAELFMGVVAMTGLVLTASVTEHRHAQSALRQMEERFRLLVESAKGYAIYMLDAEGRIATWSAEAERIKGYRAEEIIGKPFRTFFTPEDAQRGVPEQVLKKAQEEGQARYQGWRVRKDGSSFCVEGVITAMRDEGGALTGFSKVAHDVTDQKRMSELLEAKVQERTAQLRASLSSVEELLYTIAHDLRAPIRHMQGFAQLLLIEHAGRLDDTVRDYLNRISTAAARGDELIRDLLEYGRLSHEAVSLAPVDLRQAVQAVLQAVAGEIQRRHAHVQFGEEWPRVVANERLLEQILTNFVTNALLYAPPNREPEIAISAESEGGKAVLRVQDNGIGIPPDQISRVFEPFIRLPNANNAPGTGMGLAIVKKAAERLNGTVGADSTPGKGSCFWLELQAA
jgi:PAS domain S-box-containing protein